ncbi:MAG TPA: hypothetical protein VGD05_12360, partial [Pyrinomonadaceae bacterium]
MPRSTDTTLEEMLASCGSECTVDIVQRDGADYHYATDEMEIGGTSYKSLLVGVGELKESGNQATNRIDLKISNVLSEWGKKVASPARPLQGADVVVKRYFYDADNPSAYRHKHFFSGKLIAPEANEEHVSF